MATESLIKVGKECPVQNNVYYQHLSLGCLGKCPQSSKATKTIDRTRGIPCSGNMTSSGKYQTKAFLMSYGAMYRRKRARVISTIIDSNAFRQRSGSGCTSSSKPLSNFG